MNKQVKLGSEARRKLTDGINKLADAVSATLGPNGRNVIYTENGEVFSTKDGVSVAKSISNLEDPIEDLGAQMIKQTSIKTATKAGDGTTTSTLLAQKMINEGLSLLDKGANAVELKRGIDEAVKEVVNALRKNISQDISSEDQLEQIATISANNDPEVGALIAEAMKKVGREGVVHIEESKSGETYLETVEGMQFDRGYKSHYFVTDNNTMSCTLENPYILIADKRFTQVKELLPILEGVSSTGKPLLVIAEDLEGEALATLIVNKMRGTLKVCAVKAPDFGDRRKLLLDDIAILTGGQVFSSDKGMKLDKFSWDWFGSARIVTINKDQTTIVDGKGTEDTINQRVDELKLQLEKSLSAFETEKLQERLAKFVGGVSIIHVGGNSELEMKEKKDRVDDALNAAKAALEEGIVPGGGSALIYARQAIEVNKDLNDIKLGKQIVIKACAAPFMKILSNAGYTEGECYSLINRMVDGESDVWKGYNLKTTEFVNMGEAGIIDPFKVTRCALENAASVAGTILLTEGVVIEKQDKKQDAGFDPMSQMM
jgi:chaperonin GroEL